MRPNDSFGSSPNTAHSPGIGPAPMTSSSRPPDRMSTVAASSATRSGLCSGSSSTYGPSRITDVRAAAAASSGNWDGLCWSSAK